MYPIQGYGTPGTWQQGQNQPQISQNQPIQFRGQPQGKFGGDNGPLSPKEARGGSDTRGGSFQFPGTYQVPRPAGNNWVNPKPFTYSSHHLPRAPLPTNQKAPLFDSTGHTPTNEGMITQHGNNRQYHPGNFGVAAQNATPSFVINPVTHQVIHSEFRIIGRFILHL